MPNLIWFEWSKMTDGYSLETLVPNEIELAPDRPNHPIEDVYEYDVFQAGRSLTAKVGAQQSTLRVLELNNSLFYDETGFAEARWNLPDKPINFVCPVGDEFLTYRPFDSGNLIFKEFADVDTQSDGVLGFANKYGLLHKFRGNNLEQLDDWFEEIHSMNKAVKIWDQCKKTKGDFGILLNEFRSSAAGSNLTVRLERGADPERPALYIEPESLLSAMWLQFAQTVSANQQIQRCAVCTTWFAFGTGTGRRKSAHYCSDRCRKAFHRPNKEKSNER